MKYIIEFNSHDGRRLRTVPYDNYESAKLGRLLIDMTLVVSHPANSVILFVPEDADLQEVKP